VSRLPNKNLPWPITWAGVVEIANSEGCRLRAYQDIVGVWTIGWGQTAGVTPDMVWTQAEADADLCQRLTELAIEVKSCLTQPANPYELAAMLSLADNIGMGWKGHKKPKGAKDGFRQSSVLRNHNRRDKQAASRAFALWNKADGQVRNGLVARRAREATLYLTPTQAAMAYRDIDNAPATPEADGEQPLTESTMVRSGAVSAATGGLALASSVSNDIQQTAWNLGINPLMVVGVIAVVVGAVVLYQRVKQRREGRA
jgi:lysozyme